MTDKELKKLNRAELLELLLVQTRETERLRKRLEMAEEELSDRQLQIQKAGDLAHAALKINGVMEAAQAAAQQYLDNIMQMEKEARLKCDAMLAEAGRRCDAMLAEARKEARLKSDAMLAEAQKEAEQIRRSTPKAADPDDALIQEIYHLLG